MIKLLEEDGFVLDTNKSDIGYNFNHTIGDSQKVPLRLWERIETETGIVACRIGLIGRVNCLQEENIFELNLKDDVGTDERDHFREVVKGTALLTTNHKLDYEKALKAIANVGSLVKSVYRKT